METLCPQNSRFDTKQRAVNAKKTAMVKNRTAVLFLITGMLTQFMSNTAAAALLCPIGLSIAESLGASPTAVVLAIGFSASAAYMTPIAINGCYCYVIARQKNGRG